jgi:hypothetical protein
MHPARVMRPLGVALVVLLSVAAAGCDSETSLATPPPDLGIAWQPIPFSVDPTLVSAALATCSEGFLPNGAAQPVQLADVAAVDARGGNRLYLVTRGGGECLVTRQAGGQFEASITGIGGPVVGAPPPAQAGEAQVSSSGSMSGPGAADTLSTILGRAGDRVAAVAVRVGRVQFQASVGGGWFLAWWPNGQTADSVQAFGADGQPLGPAHP